MEKTQGPQRRSEKESRIPVKSQHIHQKKQTNQSQAGASSNAIGFPEWSQRTGKSVPRQEQEKSLTYKSSRVRPTSARKDGDDRDERDTESVKENVAPSKGSSDEHGQVNSTVVSALKKGSMKRCVCVRVCVCARMITWYRVYSSSNKTKFLRGNLT